MTYRYTKLQLALLDLVSREILSAILSRRQAPWQTVPYVSHLRWIYTRMFKPLSIASLSFWPNYSSRSRRTMK